VIVNVFDDPIQPLAFGVTVIMAIIGVKPLFTVVNEAIFPLPLPAKPIVGLSFVQSKVVPVRLPVKDSVPFASPLHFIRLVIEFTVGVGFTVMVNVLDEPAQLFTDGVTEIVAIIGVNPVFMAVKEGIVLEPEAAIPMLCVLVAIQLYVAPITVPEKLRVALVSPAHRTRFGVTFTSGFGFTDTTTSKGKPAQPLDEEVTVYVAVWTLVLRLVNVPEILV